jgi:hypothetical protein
MAARFANILLSVIWLPLAAMAQTPPPEVEQALRARVTEFLQYHVDGNFRKAFDLVAEDTKDSYFSSGKAQLQSFKIDDVKFTDSSFTRASVVATMSKIINVGTQDIPVSLPSTTTWKIENGKWVWYEDPKVHATPMGASTPLSAGLPGNNAAGNALPKDFDDKAIAAAARSILDQVSVDKKEITLATDKVSEQQVIFHNGMTGSVQVQVTGTEVPGFTAQIGQAFVKPASDVPVVFRYEPGNQAPPKDPVSVQIFVQPLNQVFVIRVSFATQAR